MKNFNDLKIKEQFEVICSIKKLRENFMDFVESDCIGWIEDKTKHLDCVEYNIGLYGCSYLRIKGRYGETSSDDCSAFLYSLEKSVENFGCSSEIEKQIAKCNKLFGSNLYTYECSRLCQMYFNEEIKTDLEWVEKCLGVIYRNVWSSEIADIFDIWLDGADFDNCITYNDSEGCWQYAETKIYKAA